MCDKYLLSVDGTARFNLRTHRWEPVPDWGAPTRHESIPDGWASMFNGGATFTWDELPTNGDVDMCSTSKTAAVVTLAKHFILKPYHQDANGAVSFDTTQVTRGKEQVLTRAAAEDWALSILTNARPSGYPAYAGVMIFEAVAIVKPKKVEADIEEVK